MDGNNNGADAVSALLEQSQESPAAVPSVEENDNTGGQKGSEAQAQRVESVQFPKGTRAVCRIRCKQCQNELNVPFPTSDLGTVVNMQCLHCKAVEQIVLSTDSDVTHVWHCMKPPTSSTGVVCFSCRSCGTALSLPLSFYNATNLPPDSREHVLTQCESCKAKFFLTLHRTKGLSSRKRQKMSVSAKEEKKTDSREQRRVKHRKVFPESHVDGSKPEATVDSSKELVAILIDSHRRRCASPPSAIVRELNGLHYVEETSKAGPVHYRCCCCPREQHFVHEYKVKAHLLAYHSRLKCKYCNREMSIMGLKNHKCQPAARQWVETELEELTRQPVKTPPWASFDLGPLEDACASLVDTNDDHDTIARVVTQGRLASLYCARGADLKYDASMIPMLQFKRFSCSGSTLICVSHPVSKRQSYRCCECFSEHFVCSDDVLSHILLRHVKLACPVCLVRVPSRSIGQHMIRQHNVTTGVPELTNDDAKFVEWRASHSLPPGPSGLKWENSGPLQAIPMDAIVLEDDDAVDVDLDSEMDKSEQKSGGETLQMEPKSNIQHVEAVQNSSVAPQHRDGCGRDEAPPPTVHNRQSALSEPRQEPRQEVKLSSCGLVCTHTIAPTTTSTEESSPLEWPSESGARYSNILDWSNVSANYASLRFPYGFVANGIRIEAVKPNLDAGLAFDSANYGVFASRAFEAESFICPCGGVVRVALTTELEQEAVPARHEQVVLRQVMHEGKPISVLVDMHEVGNEVRFIRSHTEAQRQCNVRLHTYVVGGTNELQIGAWTTKQVAQGEELLLNYDQTL